MQCFVRGSGRSVALFFLAFLAFATVTGQAFAAEKPQSHQLIAQATEDVNDPLEPINRFMLSVNEFITDIFLRPMGEIYVIFIPEGAREVVHNMLNNIYSPVVLINDLLQGEPGRAWDTTRRLVINTTLGVGGMFDPAKDHFGIEGHTEDLGQTFAVWGVPEGFYLVLPVFGPSNPRDAIGKLWLNSYLDPMSHYLDNTDRSEASNARTFVGGVDEFSRVMDDLQKLKETSIDYYAALRSIARQKRETEINNGVPREGAPLPDLKYDFNAEFVQ
jgi:phospholipid-binding lipoprotein MlaA